VAQDSVPFHLRLWGSCYFTAAIQPQSLSTEEQVTVTADTATLGSASATINVQPPLWLLAFNPNPVLAGASSKAAVNLCAPAPPGGLTVLLRSGSAFDVTVPPSVTIGGGQVSAPFTATTSPTTSSGAVTISADAGGLGIATTTLTIGGPLSLTLDFKDVTGGDVDSDMVCGGVLAGVSSTGTITLYTR
jgi:hypothetical protein